MFVWFEIYGSRFGSGSRYGSRHKMWFFKFELIPPPPKKKKIFWSFLVFHNQHFFGIGDNQCILLIGRSRDSILRSSMVSSRIISLRISFQMEAQNLLEIISLGRGVNLKLHALLWSAPGCELPSKSKCCVLGKCSSSCQCWMTNIIFEISAIKLSE